MHFLGLEFDIARDMDGESQFVDKRGTRARDE
jgi:hypothetical protein